jgi:cytochrome c55X
MTSREVEGLIIMFHARKLFRESLNIKRILIPILLVMVANSFADNSANSSATNSINDERKKELMHLLKQDCGSCHGMTMKGGLGPALLPEKLAATPDYILENTIKYGRETLAMPAWDGILTSVDIEWLVDQLKQGIEK